MPAGWRGVPARPRSGLAGDGVYLGMDLGVSLAPGPDTATLDNDYPTICDEFINPGDQDVSTCPSGESWTNAFDGGVGVLSGVAMGYRYGNYRFEGEYFYRGTSYNRESEPVFSGATLLKDSQEISESVEAIGDVLSHNFFANLYYDFTSDSKWTPYLGAGVGLALVSVDYSNRFTRSSDPVNIKTFGDTVNDRNRRLAGTTTVASDRLSDTLFGWQAMAGVDYQVSEPVTSDSNSDGRSLANLKTAPSIASFAVTTPPILPMRLIPQRSCAILVHDR